MARFFAVMPLVGLSGANDAMHFTWLSFPAAYCILMLILTVMYTMATICKVARHEITPDAIGIRFIH